jgi:hypothetical protein
MVSLVQLWLPWLVAAVGVFVASSLVHMVFKWHNADYLKLGNEDDVRAAIRKSAPPPGQYVIPHCTDMKDLQSPDMQRKFTEGPVAYLMVRPSGAPNIGPSLAQWFMLNVLVSGVAAHLAAATLGAGAPSEHVFHATASVTFIAYAAGSLSSGIWKGQPWRSVAKELLDALIYGIVSGFAFAWLWPH